MASHSSDTKNRPEPPAFTRLDRVVVVGTSGSGKTTLARALASRFDVPFIEMDALNWGPNWGMRDTETFRESVDRATSGKFWVADGNYGRARDIHWGRATALIWLNYGMVRCFWQVLNRCVVRIVTREKIFSGNVESFRLTFLDRESLLWWVLTTHGPRRKRFEASFKDGRYGEARVIEFRYPWQAERFLRCVSRSSGDIE
jgi:adenylate kinase family enzyme